MEEWQKLLRVLSDANNTKLQVTAKSVAKMVDGIPLVVGAHPMPDRARLNLIHALLACHTQVELKSEGHWGVALYTTDSDSVPKYIYEVMPSPKGSI
jgi:hypothetical protein